jgi:hypothetical protein
VTCHPRASLSLSVIPENLFVIPAHAGIHGFHGTNSRLPSNEKRGVADATGSIKILWIPAFAGMTSRNSEAV